MHSCQDGHFLLWIIHPVILRHPQMHTEDAISDEAEQQNILTIGGWSKWHLEVTSSGGSGASGCGVNMIPAHVRLCTSCRQL